MKSQPVSASKKAKMEEAVKRMEQETIAEESCEEEEPLVAEDKSRLGQVVFDPPYSLWRYPKKYKRYWQVFTVCNLWTFGFACHFVLHAYATSICITNSVMITKHDT